MAYKPLPILTAKKLLYLIKTMNEALTLNSPRPCRKPSCC